MLDAAVLLPGRPAVIRLVATIDGFTARHAVSAADTLL
jgi:hypothetical protein